MADASPVAHLWSLAVEEQFYFVWPIVLWGLHRVTRSLVSRRDAAVQIAVGVLAAASATWAVHLAATNLDRAYFGTDARAYQLLAGALLALSPGVTERFRRLFGPLLAQAGALLSLAAVLVLASDVVDLTAIERGLAVTVATVGLLAGLEASRSGPLVNLLSTPFLVHLGRISYGTYLWHWLVTILMHRQTGFSDPVVAVVVGVVASGLAALSYAVAEMPIRQTGRLARRPVVVVGIGLAASVLVGVMAAPQLLDGSRRPAPAALTGSTGAIALPVTTPVSQEDVSAAFFDRPDETDCVGRPAVGCISVRGEEPRVLLMGDSHAHMLVPAMERMARDHGFTLIDAAKQGCPWQLDHYVLGEEIRARCRATRTDTYARVIPELDPDVIVAINSPSVELRFGDSRHDDVLRESTPRSLDELAAPGRRIVLLEGIPRHGDGIDLRACLESAAVAESCRYRVDTEVHWAEVMYREEADSRADVWSVDIDHLICPLHPTCESMVDGQVVWRVEGHITGAYAEAIAPRLWTELVAAGIFEP